MPGTATAQLQFNVIYRASTVGAPAGFFTAFDDAIQFYQSTFRDPITINLQVGWGEINGNPLTPGNNGQSLTAQLVNLSYAQTRARLVADVTSPEDAAAVATLPVADPTGGRRFAMSTAEAKALGLLPGDLAGTDGFVGFDALANWTFDPFNRAVASRVDFIGVAHHEITEVMGRYGFGQNGSGGQLSPIDLFRYSAPGVRDLAPAFGGVANYFSIDAGTTAINSFNTTCCGDLSDWRGTTVDAYNAVSPAGRLLPTSAGDLTVMNVIGYDLVTPEPSTWALLGSGLLVIGVVATRRRSA